MKRIGIGRPKSYTADKLERAVLKYFASITRTVPITERVPTGERDGDGHEIYVSVPVVNSLGEEVETEEYIVNPSFADLYAFLKIDKSTWANYGDFERYPEHAPVVEYARDRMQAWNEKELLQRAGKDLKGIIFNLENNYGYRERQSVEVSGGVEEYLRKRNEEGDRQEF